MAKNEERLSTPEVSTAPVKRVDNKKLGFRKRFAKWFREMRSELKKVVWPTRKQVCNNTVIVFVVMFIAAVFIWGFDTLASAGVSALITVLG